MNSKKKAQSELQVAKPLENDEAADDDIDISDDEEGWFESVLVKICINEIDHYRRNKSRRNLHSASNQSLLLN